MNIVNTIHLRLQMPLFISVLIYIGASCNSEAKIEKYKYIKGLSQYMNDVHQIEISNIKEKIFYFLPLSDCSTCQGTLLNLNHLSSISTTNDKLTLIQIGKSEDLKHINLLKEIASTFTILKDSKRTISSYQTGLSKPMLVHIKDGKVEHFIQITDYKIEEAGNYIISKS